MHIPVFAPYEQAEKKTQAVRYGNFAVTSLPLIDKQMERWQHTNSDGTECPCYAFLIEADGQKLLYVTDTKLLVWNLQKVKVNHMLTGLNYIPEMLSHDEYKRYHVLTGHLGLDTVKGIVKANKTDGLMSVILCHMSAGSSNKDKCISEVKKVAGNAFVDVAEGGKEWKLYGAHECPF